jgi:hypothetical protein
MPGEGLRKVKPDDLFAADPEGMVASGRLVAAVGLSRRTSA